MELKYVIPDVYKTFGKLEYAGEGKTQQKKINGRLTVLSRSYNLYSDIQRADDIEVILVGAWFLPPISMEEVAEKIGLNETYEEYAIHDYELPFDIGEYESIDEINRLCEMAEELTL